jgi:hypothetical protein
MKTRFFPTFLTERIENPEYGIECRYSVSDRTAIFYAGKSGSPIFYTKFQTLERMNQYIKEMIENIIRNEMAKAERKRLQREANQSLKASDFYSVGDIVVNTWGWEQTNVDFYQVTEVKAKTIVVRSIAQTIVEGSMMSHGMACDVIPVKDGFFAEDDHLHEVYALRVKAGHKGEGHCLSNPESYYYFHKWDGRAEYKSWYA